MFWVPPPGGRRCPAVFQCSGKMNSPCSKVFVKGEACTAQARRQPESWVGSRRAGFDLGLGGILIYSAAMFQNGNRCGFDRWKGTPFSRGPFLLFTVAKDLKAILSQGTTSYFRLLQKRRHLLHMGGYFQTLGTVGGTRAAADTGRGPLVLRQCVQPGQTPGGQVLFSTGLILVESSEQEGNVQLLGTVGAAVAAARAGHRIETVDHIAHLPH